MIFCMLELSCYWLRDGSGCQVYVISVVLLMLDVKDSFGLGFFFVCLRLICIVAVFCVRVLYICRQGLWKAKGGSFAARNVCTFLEYSAGFIITNVLPLSYCKADRLCRPQTTMWRMYVAFWIPKATNTLSGYVILNVFPLQQWLHERASI